jgi:hypothetical protein
VLDALALAASFCLALCGLPQLLAVMRRGSAEGLSWWFLGLWGAGEAGLLGYVLARYPGDWALILNYGGNLAIVAALLRYRAKKA